MGGTLMPAPWFTGLRTNGTPVAGGLLWTYAAGTDTEAETFTDQALLVPHENPIELDGAGRAVIYLSPGRSYKVRLEEPATPPAHGSLIKEQDNVESVPGSASATDLLLTAGEDIDAGEACYVSDGSGGKTAGKAYKTDATLAYASVTPTVLFAVADVATDDVASFRLEGDVAKTGLVAGATYYLDEAIPGGIKTSAPTVSGSFVRRVGQAKSSVDLIATPNPPVTAPNYLLATNILANQSFG